MSLRHLLLKQASFSECVVHARERLDLIPSDSSLLEVEGVLWRESSKERAYRFFVNQLGGIENGYDFVLLDFPPSPNVLSECALYYVEEIIVPVAMNYMALLGIRKVLDALRSVSHPFGRAARLTWILPTFFNARLKLDNEVMGILRRYFPTQLAEPIRLNVHLAQAPGHHKTIYEYAPTSTGALDYARFVEKVCGNG